MRRTVHVILNHVHICVALLVTDDVLSMMYGTAAGRHQRAAFIMTPMAHCATIVTLQQEPLVALWVMWMLTT